MKRLPEWEWLARIRQLGVRHFATWSLVLVPLVASATVAVDNALGLKIPLPANLVVLYAATLSFYVGSMLVDTFCPDFIKEHQTFDRFLAFTVEKTGQVQDFKRKAMAARETLLTKLGREITTQTGEQITTDQTKAILDSIIAEQTHFAFVSGSDEIWKIRNKDRAEVRVVVTALFSLAAILALYLVLWDAPSRVFRAVTLGAENPN